MTTNEMIVGVDGSEASQQALVWAVGEATRRKAPLTIITAYEWLWPGARMVVGTGYADAMREQAEAIVTLAVDQARELSPSLTVRGQAVHGQPARVLIDASAKAAALVVGSRGRGGFTSLLLGSVSHQVATHATCPVVVTRGRADLSGPIVVGVDGSVSADHALGHALELARGRGVELRAVRCYEPIAPPWGPGGSPYLEDMAEREQIERELLAESITAWREKYPDVVVTSLLQRGHPGRALADLSHDASLVVIGTRGHGGFTGLMLGSVGQGLLHHGECPVLVDRTPTEG